MTGRQARSEHAAPGTAATRDTSTGTRRIVVGVDGSAGSIAALKWAVQEARQRGSSLSAVMAWQHPHAYYAVNVWGLGMDPSIDTERALASRAAAEVARLVEEAGQGQDVAIACEAVEGHPAEVLLGVAERAELLVVGTRGHGRFVGTLLGSVSQHVLAHARCPVVVIPDPQPVTTGHVDEHARQGRPQ